MSDRRPMMKGGWLAIATILLLGAILPAAGARAQSADPTRSKRLMREISVIEKVIDQMLLESKNLLVYSHEDNTRGLYLDEFGVLFSFEASLVNRGEGDIWPKDWENYSFERLPDGTVVIKPKKAKTKAGDKGSDDEESADSPKGSKNSDVAANSSPRTWMDSQAGKQVKLYEAGKQEIIDTLIEYGDSMNSLRDNQWIGIAAFLKNSDFFRDNQLSRLLVKARVSDLRAYAEGRLDRKQIAAKVVLEEY